MASSNRKRCPNCGAMNASGASNCVICGTRLGRQRQAEKLSTIDTHTDLSHQGAIVGDDDLLARNAFSTPIAVIATILILILLGTIVYLGAATALNSGAVVESTGQRNGLITAVSATVAVTPSATPFPTNTRPAPRTFATITPLPATSTPTPTEGPCVKTAQAGDTLYGLAQQCGHRNYSVVDVILTENPQLSCAACLQEGQTVNIPWPTPTIDPNAASQSQAVPSGDSLGGTPQNRAAASDGTPDVLATFFVEPTLRPGLQWHTVGSDDNLILIAQLYGADAKVLSDINPEIDFAQCDFSTRYGGELCTVLLIPGQRIRVPAPTPTPTLSVTPSGSETPTPTYTATFNVPAALSPRDDTAFDASSLVTLRWSSSGSLGPNEIYVLRVKNLDADEEFEGMSEELFFVLPEAWQPTTTDMQAFEWTVAIGTLDDGRVVSVREMTSPHTFQWQGR